MSSSTQDRQTGRRPSPGLVLRSRSVMRRLRRDLGEALGLLAELERETEYELFARYVIEPDQPISEEEREDLLLLLERTRTEHPNQELEIVFRAQRPDAHSSEREPRREEHHNGTAAGRNVQRR